uniref:Uncharacterized protein n=1 Tax=Arundo donax TaxID=35708 RepID=A0A0A8YWU4_ARUDO
MPSTSRIFTITLTMIHYIRCLLKVQIQVTPASISTGTKPTKSP